MLISISISYSNGNVCIDETEFAGNMPLRMLTLQVRDLLQQKGLHGYQEPDVALKSRHRVTPTTCVGPVAIKNTPTLKRQRLHRWQSVRGHDAYLHAHVAGTRPIASRVTVPGEKEFAGIRHLGMLTLQVRDLLQHKCLHGHQEPNVCSKVVTS